jgi:hypothetical protein
MMQGAELFRAKQNKLIDRIVFFFILFLFYFILFYDELHACATGAGRSMEWRTPPQLVWPINSK